MVVALVALLVGLATLAHSAPFPFLVDWAGPGDPIWRMPATSPPTVYLTFDDGPNPAATPAVLDTLSREGVRATFFLIDRHVTSETAPIVGRMFREGHAVGLHSHTRALLLNRPEALAAHLERVARHIEQTTGAVPCRAFRPHAGWRSTAMLAGLERAGYRLVGWGWALWDWNWFRRPEAESTLARVLAHASPGDIIVLHDGHHEDPRADRRHTVETVSRLIPALRARGYTFGTICP
jgi:peptidoglycan/xylan/chitin deacetylase (PgdA/CDA1 family)